MRLAILGLLGDVAEDAAGDHDLKPILWMESNTHSMTATPRTSSRHGRSADRQKTRGNRNAPPGEARGAVSASDADARIMLAARDRCRSHYHGFGRPERALARNGRFRLISAGSWTGGIRRRERSAVARSNAAGLLVLMGVWKAVDEDSSWLRFPRPDRRGRDLTPRLGAT